MNAPCRCPRSIHRPEYASEVGLERAIDSPPADPRLAVGKVEAAPRVAALRDWMKAARG